MEKERVQRYVGSLEQIIRNTHNDLKTSMIQFQEYSKWFASGRPCPSGIIIDIQRTYKSIDDHLTKIRGIHQLLESRYRQYYRRNSLVDRDISEIGVLSKNLFLRFESMLEETEKRKSEDKGEDSQVCIRRVPFQWFRSGENQIILLRHLRGLYDLDYIYKSGLRVDVDQRPRVIENRQRSLSLFILSGEGRSIDILQSRMRLREYDIKERYAKDELRGALTHLRDVSAGEVEGVIRRFMDSRGVPEFRCLLLSIQSHEDLAKETLSSADTILKGMMQGEIRTLQT